MTSASDINKAFTAMLKALACPSCDQHYSEAAVQWCFGYIDGRHDMLVEVGGNERHGPVKIRCMNCQKNASVDYFRKTVSLVA